MKKVTITKINNLYHKFNGATEYEIYFLQDRVLYKTTMKTIPEFMLKFDKASSKRGGQLSLRMNMLSSYKALLIKQGQAKKVVSQTYFETLSKKLGLNKGETCEYLSCKARKLPYSRDNVRFDKAGDVNLKRKKIQVKFQNATLAQVSTILKLAGIKN